MAKGYIWSFESMGLVDGPGIRTVVFFSGCSLRCAFCHNPESFKTGGGELVDSSELIKKIERFKPYFERSGGGVTFSGGEPLLQREFLVDLLRECKSRGIHTCLDTSGVGDGDYSEILSLTSLVLYDVKAVSDGAYREITGRPIDATEEFQRAMRDARVPVVVRQVVIPGINDTDEYMSSLRDYIMEKIPGCVGVELLPYHKMGSYKYDKLGLVEPYRDVPPMDKDRTDAFYGKYFKNEFGEYEN